MSVLKLYIWERFLVSKPPAYILASFRFLMVEKLDKVSLCSISASLLQSFKTIEGKTSWRKCIVVQSQKPLKPSTQSSSQLYYRYFCCFFKPCWGIELSCAGFNALLPKSQTFYQIFTFSISRLQTWLNWFYWVPHKINKRSQISRPWPQPGCMKRNFVFERNVSLFSLTNGKDFKRNYRFPSVR